ncbi:MAG: 2-oxoglutarate dehydrogenase E1 subunit family protein, partial [Actinoallomurus sp.]
MSTQSSRASAGQTTPDFGPNEWLVDELYQKYLEDPNSVDRAWWNFFADYHPDRPGKGADDVAASPPTPAPSQQAAPAAPARTAPAARPDAAKPAQQAPEKPAKKA